MLSKYLTTDARKIIDLIEAIEQKPVEKRFAKIFKKNICCMKIVQTSLWT